MRAVLAAATAAVMAAFAAACGSATPGPVAPVRLGRGRAPGTFVSLRTLRRPEPGPLGFEAVVVTDVTTGAVVRRLLPWGWRGMQVTGLALDRAGNLWVTYSRGPACTSNVAGCGPKPGTCGGAILVLHAATGVFSTFLRTSRNVQVWGAAPNPSGTLLAYRESGCANGYFNDHLRVTSLRTRRSWTIGAGLARCHLITSLSWSADGRDLVVAYAPPRTTDYRGPENTCSSPRRERLAEVNALTGQPGLVGRTATAPAGCEISSVASAAGGGAFAVEACGRPDDVTGPARLLVLDAVLKTVRVLPLGRCADGTSLATSPSGRSVLVSAYLYCNPPGRHPADHVWVYQHRSLRPVTTVRGDGADVSLMTW